MSPVHIMGVIAAYALLLPALILLGCKLLGHKSLIALFFYFLFSASVNLLNEEVIVISKSARHLLGVMSNYLDIPLMHFCLLLFCTTRQQKKFIYGSFFIFVLFEIIIFLTLGFSTNSVVYIMGPGIVLLMIYAVYFFNIHVKHCIERSKGMGKTLMTASIAFAYGCYAMVYFFYYIQKTSAIADVYTIYYVASVLSSLLMSIGLLLIHKRNKQLKEVQLTRKELAMFFNR